MKQTKKLTRSQKIFLEKEHFVNTNGVRLVEETHRSLKVQMPDGIIVEYLKEERKRY